MAQASLRIAGEKIEGIWLMGEAVFLAGGTWEDSLSVCSGPWLPFW
ncbi:hypothetical protein EKH55_4987 [Sinorhizobium alkalisoli]|nr:hypothetical protein EKH55_4987 [Sinorhizobium alkalisoli]